MNRTSRRSRPALALSAALVLTTAWAAASAASEPYTIDPVHSSVAFRIRHLVSKVSGRFGAFTGSIALDPADLSGAKVSAEIDAASIDTDNDQRNGHLKSPDFFEVEKFPKITFESTEVVAAGPNRAKMKGNLTMKGVTKPVDLDVEVLGFGPGGRGEPRGGFEARGTINRKDFGIQWNRVLDQGGTVLGDEVEIILNVEAVKANPPEAPKPSGTSR